MKLVKLFNKLSAVALAASLVVGFASCSTTTDDPFNPNAPLTLEEYVKSEIKKAIENGGAQAKPEDPSELEFESRTSLMDKIQLNNEKTEDAWGNGTKISSANPLQASEGYGWDKENGQISLPFSYDAGYFGENTHIIIEADDSALNYNADAAIKIEFKVENPSTGHSNEMNITSKFKDGVAIIPISEIGFTDSCQFLLTFRAKGTVTITKIEMAKAKGQSAPEPTPGEGEKPGAGENPAPGAGEKPEAGKVAGDELVAEPFVVDWSGEPRIAGSNFKNANDNSKIVFKYVGYGDLEDPEYYCKFKLIAGGWAAKYGAGAIEGATIANNNDPSDDEGYMAIEPTAAPEDTTTEYTITYSPTASEWATIKEKGLVVAGNGAKVISVKFIEGAAAGGEEVASFYPSLIDAESADIDGETTLNWGVSLARMKKSTLSGLKAGDKIYFTVAGSDDYKGFRIQNGDWKYNYADKIYNAESNEEKSIDEDGATFYVERATYYFVVTEENIAYFSTEEIEFHGEATVKAAVAPVK